MFFRALALLLLVPAIAGAATTTIPAAASVHGRLGTFFHSDVAILNTSRTATASVTARYRCFGGSCGSSAEQTFTIGPRQVRVFPDIIATLFNAPETGGAIEFESATPLVVTSRLYTPSRPEPTYGQFVPGLKNRDAFALAVLTSLSHSTDPTRGFRSNLGVYNPTGQTIEVAFALYDVQGTLLGTMERTIPPFQPLQINDIFGVMGVQTNVASGYCEISSGIGGPPIFAYASVVDNQSQDPIFVVGRESFSFKDGTMILPAVASLHGRLGTFFHSDVFFHGTGTLTATYRCFGGNCGESVKTIAVDDAMLAADIVATLFKAPETGGAIELESTFRRAIDSRLYTPSRPEPTVGQFVPAMAPHDWHFTAVVTSLAHSPDGATGFRSNVGAYNPHDVALTVTFEVFDETGTSLGTLTRELGPHAGVQINDIFGAAGVTREIRSGYCTVRGDGVHGVIAYGSVIDNLSQDPIFVPGQTDDGCDYVLGDYDMSFDGAGGNQDITVTTSPGCAWTITEDLAWLTPTTGASGSGSGTIRLNAAPNPVMEARKAKLLIAGQKVAVEQRLGSYDGQWRGSTGLGSLTFSVSFNRTSSWTIPFTAQGSGCSIFGTVTRSGIGRITDGKMEEVRMTGSATGGTYSFTINGNFPTLFTASGTMTYSITSGSCTASGSTTWFATKQ